MYFPSRHLLDDFAITNIESKPTQYPFRKQLTNKPQSPWLLKLPKEKTAMHCSRHFHLHSPAIYDQRSKLEYQTQATASLSS
jgi:hypothetical protein